jgi:hypothetical protein
VLPELMQTGPKKKKKKNLSLEVDNFRGIKMLCTWPMVTIADDKYHVISQENCYR